MVNLLLNYSHLPSPVWRKRKEKQTHVKFCKDNLRWVNNPTNKSRTYSSIFLYLQKQTYFEGLNKQQRAQNQPNPVLQAGFSILQADNTVNLGSSFPGEPGRTQNLARIRPTRTRSDWLGATLAINVTSNWIWYKNGKCCNLRKQTSFKEWVVSPLRFM